MYKRLHKDIETEIKNYSSNNSYLTSVLLDRLMILFFLQGNKVLPKNTLQENLNNCIKENKSFHHYLVRLLELINTEYSKRKSSDLDIQNIPYLNISILKVPTELNNFNLENELYQSILKKFSRYVWKFEEDNKALTITPSVLGNVFEKYINQKDMGAYYTEVDTTNYITKNTVILAVINKLENKDKLVGSMITKLINNPETFIVIEKNHKYSYEKRHYQSILVQIEDEVRKGNVKDFEDFVRHNIDLLSLIISSVQEESSIELLEDIYETLKGISILDPTCGTGAFIISALDIMLELYNSIDNRLCDINKSNSLSIYKETENKEFNFAKYCIENNLYGVDIMEESIEILKTRLYLRLLNCFKDKSNIISFPEIKLNFKSGNSLVGEVKITEKEIDLNEMDRLTFLNYSTLVSDTINFEEWKQKVKPFHWYKEYDEILENGGFDCIIGNPPYIEYSKVKKFQYELFGYKTIKCGNLYAFTLERSYQLLKEDGILGMIVPISIISTPRMSILRELFEDNSQFVFYSNFGDRPGTLFNGVHQKLTIVLTQKKSSNSNQAKIYTSNYYHWYKDEREKLFRTLYYLPNPFIKKGESSYYKIGDKQQVSIINKINENKQTLEQLLGQKGSYKIYLSMRMTFWTKAFLTDKKSNEFKEFGFQNETDSKVVMALLNSTLFFMYWECISDCWHLTGKELRNFKFDIEKLDGDIKIKLESLAEQLENELEHSKVYIGSVQTEYEYRHKKCKHIIDQIDMQVGKHYGLTKSELEYLKFYQLKYRMSDELETYLNELGGE
ncbi:Eco57I restriction-modification methylase domain-containing protein [Ornithinibacillus halophilus]|nr:Eco57I restriction-modification methylase domain-containing protein [Ornithinibacillus halophilus]